jgi:hypothetical protein
MRQLSKSNNKFRAVKVECDGITFDSKAEAKRYQQLKLLEIVNLRRQVAYQIIPGVVINGRKSPPTKYIADFVYFDNSKGAEVIEDCKGFVTKDYIIKRKLMKHVHNIDIFESKVKA